MKAGAGMPKSLRLTSQAEYTRAHRATPVPGYELSSTYDGTVGSAVGDKSKAESLCREARAAAKRNDMIHEAVTKLDASVYDRALAAATAITTGKCAYGGTLRDFAHSCGLCCRHEHTVPE